MPNTEKQEAIRKAYGEYWGRLPKKIKEEIFLLDGWLDWLSLNDINIGLLWFEIRNGIEVNIDFDKDRLRPKSLQGIENNNGWIRIESEEDLPKASIEAHFMLINGDIEAGIFDLVSSTFQNVRREYFLLRQVTHYQPIVKPEKPIY